MASKTNGTSTASRRKKAVASTQSLEAPVAQTLPSAKTANLEEEIRRRAYEIYLEHKGTMGDEHHDWLIAEQEIRARHHQGYSA